MTDVRKQIEMYRSSDRWNGPTEPIAEELEAITMIGQERLEITIIGKPAERVESQTIWNLEDMA